MYYNIGMAKLEDEQLLRDLYITQRLDTNDIATRLGVGHNTVVRAFAKYGIKKEDRFPKQFTLEQRSILYGSLLGDANLAIQKNGTNACLRMEHSIKQEEWLRWKFEYFRPWVNAKEPTFQMNKTYSSGNLIKPCPSIKFTTVATPLFTEVYYQFYSEGKKLVTKAVMDKVDALALAVWFQDDASYCYNAASRSNYMKIATHGFSRSEQEILRAYFRTKWSIDPCVDTLKNGEKQYYYLHFRADDAKSLVEYIRPYVIPSLAYKLDPRHKANSSVS